METESLEESDATEGASTNRQRRRIHDVKGCLRSLPVVDGKDLRAMIGQRVEHLSRVNRAKMK